MECIIPQLGSVPINDKVGSGFYSVSDYQEILEKATQLHIEVSHYMYLRESDSLIYQSNNNEK